MACVLINSGRYMLQQEYRVIPFATMSPAACSIIADRGEAAIAVFDHWKVGRVLRYRLGQAVRHLRAVSARNSYGTTDAALSATIEALNLALDFFQISACLPSERVEGIAQELAVAVQGNLSGTGAIRTAEEYQTQYWFGMLLARAGLKPAVPPLNEPGKRPDFIISLHGLPAAVEVKRPERFYSARDALDRAASQVRHRSRPGILALDLSDCLGVDALATAALDCPFPIREVVRAPFLDQSAKLGRRPESYNQSDKYKKVLALVTFARIAGWRRVDLSQPEGTLFIQIFLYDQACRGILIEQTSYFQRALMGVVEEITGAKPVRIAS